MVGIRSFPFGMTYFQGRAVSFRECEYITIYIYTDTFTVELLIERWSEERFCEIWTGESLIFQNGRGKILLGAYPFQAATPGVGNFYPGKTGSTWETEDLHVLFFKICFLFKEDLHLGFYSFFLVVLLEYNGIWLLLLLMAEILHHLGCMKPDNNGINYLSTGAGFQPSTVWLYWWKFYRHLFFSKQHWKIARSRGCIRRRAGVVWASTLGPGVYWLGGTIYTPVI